MKKPKNQTPEIFFCKVTGVCVNSKGEFNEIGEHYVCVIFDKEIPQCVDFIKKNLHRKIFKPTEKREITELFFDKKFSLCLVNYDYKNQLNYKTIYNPYGIKRAKPKTTTTRRKNQAKTYKLNL